MKSDGSRRGDEEERAAGEADVLVQVESEPYRQFSDWLDGELTKLIARWERHAAPAAGQVSRGRFRRVRARS